MRFFIINLKSATQRMADITALCEKYRLEFIRIEAVNGKELSAQDCESLIDKDKMLKAHKRELSRGEIGCALSHKSALEKIVELQSPAVILEDDVVFDEKLVEFLGHIKELPKDLELLLLGHQRQVYNDDGFRIESPYSRRFCKEVMGYKIRRLVGRGNGAYGYFITPKGAQKLLAHLQKLYLPLDALTCNENCVNLYALFPVLITTNPKYMQETSTQENINLCKRRHKLQKILKKWQIFWKFLLPSFRKLKEYHH